jgi:hypothetical protein
MMTERRKKKEKSRTKKQKREKRKDKEDTQIKSEGKTETLQGRSMKARLCLLDGHSLCLQAFVFRVARTQRPHSGPRM